MHDANCCLIYNFHARFWTDSIYPQVTHLVQFVSCLFGAIKLLQGVPGVLVFSSTKPCFAKGISNKLFTPLAIFGHSVWLDAVIFVDPGGTVVIDARSTASVISQSLLVLGVRRFFGKMSA